MTPEEIRRSLGADEVIPLDGRSPMEIYMERRANLEKQVKAVANPPDIPPVVTLEVAQELRDMVSKGIDDLAEAVHAKLGLDKKWVLADLVAEATLKARQARQQNP